MAHAVNAGHEPRPLAEALVRHLRNGFLSLMAPELVPLPSQQVDVLAAQAQRLGPAALVRAIERLGEILVELRHAPDPRVLVEVALVQLTSAPDASAGDDIGPLAARVDRPRAGARGRRGAGRAGRAHGPDDGAHGARRAGPARHGRGRRHRRRRRRPRRPPRAAPAPAAGAPAPRRASPPTAAAAPAA